MTPSPTDPASSPRQSFSQPNKSILAAVECLQWLATSERPVGSMEMAELMDVDRTRANRILKSLAMAGMAEQTKGRKFVVGSGFHILAAQSLRASGILHAAAPVLETRHALDCIVALGVLWKRSVAYLYYHHPGQSTAQSLGAKFPHPVLRSSIGQMLLAQLEPGEIERLFAGRDLAPYPSLEAMQAQLDEFRRQGHARIDGKLYGISTSLGAPIRYHKRVVAAVAFSYLPEGADEGAYLEKLKETARQIEEQLAAEERALFDLNQEPA
ncbi:MAG: IclR family transcriptional regulator C-terminal domain-containing protein [Verrucomicrobiota bacterium]